MAKRMLMGTTLMAVLVCVGCGSTSVQKGSAVGAGVGGAAGAGVGHYLSSFGGVKGAAWKTDCGELRELNGLLAVRLPEAGSYTVRLRYLPTSFVVGLAVSVLSILAWTLACRRIRREGPGRSGANRMG